MFPANGNIIKSSRPCPEGFCGAVANAPQLSALPQGWSEEEMEALAAGMFDALDDAVRLHVKRIYQRLSMLSRAELMARYISPAPAKASRR